MSEKLSVFDRYRTPRRPLTMREMKTMFDYPPPRLLSVEAMVVWHYYQQHLREQWRFFPSAAPMFAHMCTMEAYLAKHCPMNWPLSVSTPNGAVTQNPDWLMYLRIAKELEKLWTSFDISPAWLVRNSGDYIDAEPEQYSPVQIYLPDNGRDPHLLDDGPGPHNNWNAS
jgi:hypothetical protein